MRLPDPDPSHPASLLRGLRALLLGLVLLAPLTAFAGEAEIRAFAHSMGLRDLDGFLAAVTSLRQRHALPERYLDKDAAEDQGWQPGSDLCDSAPGAAIGGDRFGNRERRLPQRRGRQWYEADLDFACGRRGAKRLLFSSDGLIYVTVDHYETFRQVPP